MSRSIPIIVGSEQPDFKSGRGPNKGDTEEQGLGLKFIGGFFSREKMDIPTDRFEASLKSISRGVSSALENVKNELGSYQVSTVTISLAINAQGEIGIATVGMEASIAIELEPQK